MKQPANKDECFPLGVDVVELGKAKTFYETHQDRLSVFLTKSERNYVQRSSRPHVTLALFLAAKEAGFKAVRPAWVGVMPFRDIEVVPRKNRPFSLRLKGQIKQATRSRAPLELLFSQEKDHVVALIHKTDALELSRPV